VNEMTRYQYTIPAYNTRQMFWHYTSEIITSSYERPKPCGKQDICLILSIFASEI